MKAFNFSNYVSNGGEFQFIHFEKHYQ